MLKKEARINLQLKTIILPMYVGSPIHGAYKVNTVLNTFEL